MSTLIRRATENDSNTIADIGRIAVALSHRHSCSAADMNHFIDAHYNGAAIMDELRDPANIYHLIFCDEQPAGFSKIILNAAHPNVPHTNAAKLDRIYLNSNFYDRKLGHQLLWHSVALSKENDQSGIWLFTWTGNERAVNFYKRNGFEIIGNDRFKISDTHYNPQYQMFLTC